MEAKYITHTDLIRLKECMDEDAWLCFWLMLETGLRVSDALSLKRDNVKKDGVHYRAQKTGKRGVAQISDILYSALRSRPSGLLFPSPKGGGKALTRQAVWKRIKGACHRAGLDPSGISPHAMRKVFAVETFRQLGFEATRVALQHSGRDTTEIYAYADFTTGENANKPLTRGDLKMIVGLVVKALQVQSKPTFPPKKR